MKKLLNASNPISKIFLFALMAGALGVVSCVTVNVNFPESTVQKATDDYVKDLYRAKEKGKPQASPIPSASSSFLEKLNWIQPAYAAEAFNLNFAELGPIKERQVARVSEILELKRSGSVGENRSGMLEIRGKDKIKPLLLKKIEKTVHEENQDRDALYKLVLKKNGQPQSHYEKLAQSFAKSFQAESPSGTFVQGEDGSWSQKP